MHPPIDPLTALLRRADPAAGTADPAPGDFAAAVHRRIQQGDTASIFVGHARQIRLLYPLAAALALIASLGLGSGLAYSRARESRAATFAAAYVRSIDPWTMHSGHWSPP
jgi:hypothetical protein